MIATLYNRALEQLVSPSWPSSFNFYQQRYNMWTECLHNYQRSATSSLEVKSYKELNLQWPSFRYLDQNQYLRIRGAMNYTMMKSAAGVEYDGMLEETAVTMDSAAPSINSEAVATDSEDEAVDTGSPENDNFEYRGGDVLQAFWMPSLVADKDGNIDIHFTMPNANGSWRLAAFAWDKDNCEAARYMAECMSNKPVMVQPNLPRFLRQG